MFFTKKDKERQLEREEDMMETLGRYVDCKIQGHDEYYNQELDGIHRELDDMQDQIISLAQKKVKVKSKSGQKVLTKKK